MITKEYLQQELAKRIDGYKRGVETSTDNIIAEMKSILVLVDALNDYEKKYKEALVRVKKYYDMGSQPAHVDLEYIFPELRESEDERIRKALIQFLNDIKSISESGRTSWAVRKEDAEMCKGFLTYLEKQEQKPSWSEEDEKMLWSAINGLNIHIYEKERAWLANKLKSLRPQPSWKPSEEQMKALETTAHLANFGCDTGRRNTLLSLCNDLKKL